MVVPDPHPFRQLILAFFPSYAALFDNLYYHYPHQSCPPQSSMLGKNLRSLLPYLLVSEATELPWLQKHLLPFLIYLFIIPSQNSCRFQQFPPFPHFPIPVIRVFIFHLSGATFLISAAHSGNYSHDGISVGGPSTRPFLQSQTHT